MDPSYTIFFPGIHGNTENGKKDPSEQLFQEVLQNKKILQEFVDHYEIEVKRKIDENYDNAMVVERIRKGEAFQKSKYGGMKRFLLLDRNDDRKKFYPNVEGYLLMEKGERYDVQKFVYEIVNILTYPSDELREGDELKYPINQELDRIYSRVDESKSGVLSPEQLELFIDIVKGKINGLNVSSFFNKPMSRKQFKDTIMNLIQHHHSPAVWAILYHFGYEEAESDDEFPVPEVSPEEYLLPSSFAIEKLTEVFQKLDSDHDGFLTENEWRKVYGFPEDLKGIVELASSTPSEEPCLLSLDSFIDLWYLTVQQDPSCLTQFLESNDENLFEFQKKRKYRKEEDPEPKVYNIFIFGSLKSGKTTLRYSLVRLPFQKKPFEIASPYSIFSQPDVDGEICKVILRECDETTLEQPDLMSICDACLFVYSAEDKFSFSALPAIHKKIDVTLPTLYLQTFSEVENVQQEYTITPKEFWSLLQLPTEPQIYSATHDEPGKIEELRSVFIMVLQNPEISTPVWQSEISSEDDYKKKSRKRRLFVGTLLTWATTAGVLSTLSLFAILMIKRIKNRNK